MSKIAVNPLIVAYIGGRNVKGSAKGRFSNNTIGSKFGDLKSNTSLSDSHFIKSNKATTTGTNTDTMIVSRLYNILLFIE